MTRETKLLRALPGMLLVGLALASGLLYIVGLDLATDYPEVAHLRLPTYVAVLVGLAAVVMGVKIVFDLLSVVERGEAFSPWFAAEVVTLVFTLVALLERLFSAELEHRQDNELTV
jgi:Protein of unknown function (DUF2975)